ncbi:MAG: hypothetical protein ACOYNS_14400 [Bacteroidota bacterium]
MAVPRGKTLRGTLVTDIDSISIMVDEVSEPVSIIIAKSGKGPHDSNLPEHSSYYFRDAVQQFGPIKMILSYDRSMQS